MGSDAGPAWRRLHPASLVVNLLPQAWRVLRAFWPLLVVALLNRRSADSVRPSDVAFFLLFVGLSATRTVVHYLTLRYRMNEGRLEIHEGLINRATRVIDPARIQNVNLVQNVFHKLSGLVELRVETAGDSSSEGLLSALSLAEATQLREALEAARGSAAAPASTQLRPPLLENGPLELVAYGLSASRLGAVAFLLIAGMDALNSVEPGGADEAARRLGPGATLAVVLLAFAASQVLAGAGSLLRHWRFRLVRQGDRLSTQEGLFTTRRVEIPLSKVQMLTADEPLLRRLMGYGTVSIETAALSFDEGRARQAEATLPMVASEQLGATLLEAAPAIRVDPWNAELSRPHPRALLRTLSRGLLRASLISSVLIGLTWGTLSAYSLLFPLIALPWAVVAAVLDWRWQGWLLTPAAVIARRGWFSRRTVVVARDKVQTVELHQGPVLRLLGLALPLVRAAGGSNVQLPLLGMQDAQAVFRALSGPAQKEAHGDDAADDPGDVGGDPGPDGVASAGDADRAEVDGQDVEGGLHRAVHGAGELADVGVGAVGLDEVGGQGEGA